MWIEHGPSYLDSQQFPHSTISELTLVIFKVCVLDFNRETFDTYGVGTCFILIWFSKLLAPHDLNVQQIVGISIFHMHV